MNPLDALLQPLARILNRKIAESTPAREYAAALDGRVVAVRIEKSSLAVCFRFDDGEVSLQEELPDDPDVIVSGSMLTLGRLAATRDESAYDGISITGNVHKAQAFQRLLRHTRPELEEGLAGVVGDAPAHALGNAARAVADWARNARRTLGENLRDYVTEEGRNAPARPEFTRFRDDVRALRDDVDRLAARIDRLRRNDPGKAPR